MKKQALLVAVLLSFLPAVVLGATLKFGGPIDQAQAGRFRSLRFFVRASCRRELEILHATF